MFQLFMNMMKISVPCLISFMRVPQISYHSIRLHCKDRILLKVRNDKRSSNHEFFFEISSATFGYTSNIHFLKHTEEMDLFVKNYGQLEMFPLSIKFSRVDPRCRLFVYREKQNQYFSGRPNEQYSNRSDTEMKHLKSQDRNIADECFIYDTE